VCVEIFITPYDFKKIRTVVLNRIGNKQKASTDANMPLIEGVLTYSILRDRPIKRMVIFADRHRFVWGPPDSDQRLTIPLNRIEAVECGFPRPYGSFEPVPPTFAFYIRLKDTHDYATFAVSSKAERDSIVRELRSLCRNTGG
jgi:hypothetical protein